MTSTERRLGTNPSFGLELRADPDAPAIEGVQGAGSTVPAIKVEETTYPLDDATEVDLAADPTSADTGPVFTVDAISGVISVWKVRVETVTTVTCSCLFLLINLFN